MERVYYLERSPLTGDLQSVDEQLDAIDYYRPGELYILVQHDRVPAESYAVRVAVQDLNIVDDRLELISGTQYKLRFVSSKLQQGEPRFDARLVGECRGKQAWHLMELDPPLMDELEEKFGYNVLGDTSID